MRHSRWLLWVFPVSLIIFYGCGYDVCVGPFGGNCYDQDSDGSAATNGGLLTVTPAKLVLTQGETIAISVTGGVPPYTFRNPPLGSITSGGMFTAPAQSGVAVLITVVDAQNQLGYGSVTVQ